jgi:hypothetical protein
MKAIGAGEALRLDGQANITAATAATPATRSER